MLIKQFTSEDKLDKKAAFFELFTEEDTRKISINSLREFLEGILKDNVKLSFLSDTQINKMVASALEKYENEEGITYERWEKVCNETQLFDYIKSVDLNTVLNYNMKGLKIF